MLGIRHFLIASDTLLGHEVRISTTPSCRTILVVNIYHKVMIGTFLNGMVKPSSPLLRTDLYEAKLDATDAPLLIERKYLVEFLVQGTLVDINPYADALALGILTEFRHIEVTVLRHCQGRRRHLHLWSIPSRIEFDVLQASVHTEIHSLQGGLHIQSANTESLAWSNPLLGISYLIRLVEIEHHLLIIDEVDGSLPHHDESPRHIVGGDDVGRLIH